MEKILLDTNFLLIPSQFGIDIFSELDRLCNFPYSLHVLDKSIDELKRLCEKGKGKNKDAAKIALSIIEQKKISIIFSVSSKYVDDIILMLDNYIVCTVDIELRNKLKEQGKKVIILRQKKYLQFF